MGRYEGADLFSVRCFGINKINIKAKALAWMARAFAFIQLSHVSANIGSLKNRIKIRHLMLLYVLVFKMIWH
jgi:hypothetical protein